jgi:hypothetical protein
MKKKLISALETFGFPVMLQGSLNAEAAYPDTFITFWCDSTEDSAHFDNDSHVAEWYFSVIVYSNNPHIVNTLPSEIITALKQEGFISQGKGQDILSDEPTHTGWAMDFIGTENKEL